MRNRLCPYCGNFLALRDSKTIYGVSYGKVWVCQGYPNCDAYVGCHKGSDKPLGTPARKYLRDLRMECHETFDKLWRRKGATFEEVKERRTKAYEWLAGTMGLSKSKAHIGKFDEQQCIDLLKQFEEAPELIEPLRVPTIQESGRPSWF